MNFSFFTAFALIAIVNLATPFSCLDGDRVPDDSQCKESPESPECVCAYCTTGDCPASSSTSSSPGTSRALQEEYSNSEDELRDGLAETLDRFEEVFTGRRANSAKSAKSANSKSSKACPPGADGEPRGVCRPKGTKSCQVIECGSMGMMGMTRFRRALREKPIAKREALLLPQSYSYNPSLSNVDWAKFDLDDFSKALQCEKLPSDRPIHDVSTWRHLRQTYEDVVGPSRSSINRALSDIEAKGLQIRKTEMPVAAQDANALRVERVPGKGRGIIASRDIKAGEKIWSDIYLAEFYERLDLNLFLAVLSSELACDIILWTYNIDTNPEDFYYSVDLDLGTFCNDGGANDSNIKWKSSKPFDTNTAIAARDISAGEEILCDYEGEGKY